MKNKGLHISIALLVSLYIYLFYRTESIFVTRIFSLLFSKELFLNIQQSISKTLTLNSWVIYSLPEGLWIYATTLASKDYYISIKNSKLNLVFLPLLVAFSIEFFQLINLSNGTFDLIDLIFATFFSALGYFLPFGSSLGQTKFQLSQNNSLLCLSTYLIVFLAHSSI